MNDGQTEWYLFMRLKMDLNKSSKYPEVRGMAFPLIQTAG
jgi:hypothetical protein